MSSRGVEKAFARDRFRSGELGGALSKLFAVTVAWALVVALASSQSEKALYEPVL